MPVSTRPTSMRKSISKRRPERWRCATSRKKNRSADGRRSGQGGDGLSARTLGAEHYVAAGEKFLLRDRQLRSIRNIMLAATNEVQQRCRDVTAARREPGTMRCQRPYSRPHARKGGTRSRPREPPRAYSTSQSGQTNRLSGPDTSKFIPEQVTRVLQKGSTPAVATANCVALRSDFGDACRCQTRP